MLTHVKQQNEWFEELKINSIFNIPWKLCEFPGYADKH